MSTINAFGPNNDERTKYTENAELGRQWMLRRKLMNLKTNKARSGATITQADVDNAMEAVSAGYVAHNMGAAITDAEKAWAVDYCAKSGFVIDGTGVPATGKETKPKVNGGNLSLPELPGEYTPKSLLEWSTPISGRGTAAKSRIDALKAELAVLEGQYETIAAGSALAGKIARLTASIVAGDYDDDTEEENAQRERLARFVTQYDALIPKPETTETPKDGDETGNDPDAELKPEIEEEAAK